MGDGLAVRHAIAAAAARFAFSATPRLDAELLMAHALRITREALLLGHLHDPAPAGFAALVERRAAHEPVAYVTGTRDFWTIDLHVGPGVLIPRPDSETLIAAAVDHFAGTGGPARILDLGTGPGTLLLAALDQWPAARGVGIDASAEALAWAARNAARLGMTDRVSFLEGGWDGDGTRHDLVLCNPPYVAADDALPREVAEWEPAEALYGGPDGLGAYRDLAPRMRGQIAPGGAACVEIGATQADAVAALLRAAGLATALRRDLAGRDRCIVATP